MAKTIFIVGGSKGGVGCAVLVIVDSKDTFWDDAARELIRGLLVHVAGFRGPHHHLGEVRLILTSSQAELDRVLADMASTNDGIEIPNAGKQFLGTADIDTAKLVSSSLGDATIEVQTTSRAPGKDILAPRSKTVAQQFIARPLLKTEEIMAHRDVIVLLPPSPPFDLAPVNHLRDRRHRSPADANPHHH
jgi:hypothetical protein